MFENTLFAACERSSWILHSYCILDNHYHLALETPEPNPSVGMQWLQATFGNRFNRIVHSRGHVFQGRYKSLVVDRDAYMGTLLDYIHLNPVRAGIVSRDCLPDYRWSSLWCLYRKRKRPACMNSSSCLYYAGTLADTPIGRKKYAAYLDWICESDAEQANDTFNHLSRGWALGPKAFKSKLLEDDHVQWVESVGRETEEARSRYWETVLAKLFAYHGKTAAEIQSDKKSASWKVTIAYYMKKHTVWSNAWLSTRLNMGRPQGVSQYVAAFEESKGFKERAYKKMIGRINT